MVSPTKLREIWTEEREREIFESFSRLPQDGDIKDMIAYLANYWGSSVEESIMAVYLLGYYMGGMEKFLVATQAESEKEAEEEVEVEGGEERKEEGRKKRVRRKKKEAPSGD